MRRSTTVVVMAAALGGGAGGCLGGISHEEPPLAEVIGSFGPALTKVNEEPVESGAVPGMFIDVWASEPAAREYLRVINGESGSQVTLPEGSVILRVLRDRAGRATRFTAIVKREPGFHPPADFSFAVFDADGQKARGPDGALMEGTLAECLACHLTRPADGYLFGWPRR